VANRNQTLLFIKLTLQYWKDGNWGLKEGKERVLGKSPFRSLSSAPDEAGKKLTVFAAKQSHRAVSVLTQLPDLFKKSHAI
jgi:hypothetical protein